MNTNNGNNLLRLFLALSATGAVGGGSFLALRWAGGHNCIGFINNCPAPSEPPKSKDLSTTTKVENLPSIESKPSTKSEKIPSIEPSSPTTTSFCPLGTKTLITAETNDFLVFICGENRPSKYVGIAKSGGASIHLPLSDIQSDSFTARNGSVAYILTPRKLIVTEDGKTLREDLITSYQSNGG